MLWDEAIPPMWSTTMLKLQFGEMKQEERGRVKKKKFLNVVAIGYHDPKLHAKEHRELTAHICNLHFPSARTCWNRNNTEHPKRRRSVCLHYCTFMQPANTTSSECLLSCKAKIFSKTKWKKRLKNRHRYSVHRQLSPCPWCHGHTPIVRYAQE